MSNLLGIAIDFLTFALLKFVSCSYDSDEEKDFLGLESIQDFNFKLGIQTRLQL